ncbi:MAG: HEPN domain-containing protein [Candidatus Bathyarchaeia archaeon]|nr:HEPN domain-containing protein [Candidatus Bathyarchaeota archaeon]
MRKEASLWMKQAENDLRKAENDLKTYDWDSAAFWSQQAAEKALKALLLNFGKSYRGHNLLELRDILKTDAGLDVGLIEKELKELTIHYTISRYPNAANALPIELYDQEKAYELVEKARKVVEWVKRYLH